MPLADDAVIVALLVLDFLVLNEHNVDLGVEHELFTNHVQLVLVQLLQFAVIVTTHLGVLLLEQGDMLETGLLVIKQGANAGLLFVFHDFFF